MNKFMGKHWNKRYQYITQCSIDHPFVRKLGTGEISFTDPCKLIEYLMKSEEAAFMWTDSEDLAVVSDMYQVKIKVITTKGEEDKNPIVNYICPDETLKESSELKNVELDEIVLLHQEDCHFDLIISKDNDLATKGSLSYRSNIGPLLEVNDEEVGDKEEEDSLKNGSTEKNDDN